MLKVQRRRHGRAAADLCCQWRRMPYPHLLANLKMGSLWSRRKKKEKKNAIPRVSPSQLERNGPLQKPLLLLHVWLHLCERSPQYNSPVVCENWTGSLRARARAPPPPPLPPSLCFSLKNVVRDAVARRVSECKKIDAREPAAAPAERGTMSPPAILGFEGAESSLSQEVVSLYASGGLCLRVG